MSIWEKTKEAASKATTATKDGVIKAKLKAEISMQQSKIKSSKEKFGIDVWNFFDMQDWTGAQSLYDSVKKTVTDHQKLIEDKESEIKKLAEKKKKPVETNPGTSPEYTTGETPQPETS